MNFSILFLKLLLNGGLLYIASTKTVTYTVNKENQETLNYRLPNNIIPLHYDIKLSLYDNSEITTIQGESNITIEINRATSKISLHILQICLHDVTLIDSTGTNYKYLGYNYNSDSNIIVFDFDHMIPEGFYNLYIKHASYLLEYEKNGTFKTSYKNKEGKKILQIATFSQPCWVRRLFPCWDEPVFEATFNISVKHYAKYSVVTNTPIEKQQADKNGMMWTHFYKTTLTPTYRLALVIVMSNMIHVSNVNNTIYLWYNPSTWLTETKPVYNPQWLAEITNIFHIAELINDKLNWHSRSSFKMQKMDIIGITDFNGQSIGNWGVTLHKQAYLLYNKDYDGIMRQIEIARRIARTMAYQWLDNALTPSWWSDIWLNEGLAILFQVDILNKIWPQWRIPDLFVVQMQHESLHLDTIYNMMSLVYEVNSPFEIDSLLSLPFYVKASSIVRMLQHIVTNVKTNPNAMYEYFNINQFKGISSVDFWTAMQNTLGMSSGSNAHNNYKLSSVMDTWTLQQLYPILKVTRNYITGQVTVSQENANMIDKSKWWIPLTYTAQENPNFSDTMPKAWLKPELRNVTFDKLYQKDEWIIFNLQQTGYYRVNYDMDNWVLIARFLNEDDYTKIHILNRAQIIDDAYHFMVAEQFPFTLFLKITNYLSRETDYIPWYPMFKALENLSSYLPYKESKTLQKHAEKILHALLLKLDYDKNDNDDELTECLRLEAAKWACIFGNTKCRNVAYEKVLMHLENPNSLRPEWKFWAYCNGLKMTKNYIWGYEVPFESENRKLIELIHCPGLSLIKHQLQMMNMNKITKSNNIPMINTIYALVSNAKINLKNTLELMKNYSISYIVKTLTAIINNAYTNAELDEIKKFVQNYLQKKKREKEIIVNVERKIKKRLSQIKKQLKNLLLWNIINESN